MEDKSIKIAYIKSPDFRTNLVTGIYGGLSPNGLLNLNFFVDRVALPNFQTMAVDEKGVSIPNVKPKDTKDSDLVREIQFGVLLNLETARSVINWMQERVADMEKRAEPAKTSKT
jgi:hypothetical protein